MSLSASWETWDLKNRLLGLPLEILDEILSELDTHADLMAFAMCSHMCADLVLPKHAEYRVLRVRHRRSEMWAHLARRADLARNIREVYICQKDDQTATDRFPTTLVPSLAKMTQGQILQLHNGGEDRRVVNICTALGHMKRLTTFTWDCYESCSCLNSSMTVLQEAMILHALSKLPWLERLSLSGNFKTYGTFMSKPLSPMVCEIRNLQYLALFGDVWTTPSTAEPLKALLRLSPQLKGLEIPIEASAISVCTFPKLEKLKLFLQSGTSSSINQKWNTFLENHPTLKEISCFPSIGIVLPEVGLPQLKSLRTDSNMLDSVAQSQKPPVLESVYGILDAYNLGFLSGPSFRYLKKLEVSAVFQESDLGTITETCGRTLKWLAISACPKFELNVWIGFLSSLPALQVFRGPAIWMAVDDDMTKMHNAIMKLVAVCPRLEQLDHRSLYAKRRKFKRIVIIKEDREEGPHVRYEVTKPPSRLMFDPMDGVFD
ncbi:hypothetical protein K435DRAFT_762148 [Dendrothele bispora CBS 962.96]|uniref:F-box domain-containing protein n=1 Tax=Dendrothele bispora (strain CBS 962.96) TaxID=1314807 RepID=A0A4S8LH34_DENBC|nr:hypothetical protein K435DRAFT_762148 [Dendrothele bispora CBS 962.96]